MSPVVIAAGISLLGGLMGQQAQKKQAEEERRFRGEQQGFETQRQAYGAMTSGQQQAFRELMEGFKSSLL